MEISIAVQTLVFLKSILLGTALGVIYDVLRAARRTARAGVGATAAYDALFWMILLPALFVFVLTAANGEGRGYILLGMTLGGALYFLTLSPPLLTLLCWLSRMLRTLGRIPRRVCMRVKEFTEKHLHWVDPDKKIKKNLQKLFHFHGK